MKKFMSQLIIESSIHILSFGINVNLKQSYNKTTLHIYYVLGL